MKMYFFTVIACLFLSGCASTQTQIPADKLRAYYGEGDKAYNNNEFQKALEIYLDISTQLLSDATLWFKIGNSHARLDQPFRAINAYEKALVIDPYLPKAWHNMGVIQLKQSINTWRQMLVYTPKNDPLYYKAINLSKNLVTLNDDQTLTSQNSAPQTLNTAVEQFSQAETNKTINVAAINQSNETPQKPLRLSPLAKSAEPLPALLARSVEQTKKSPIFRELAELWDVTLPLGKTSLSCNDVVTANLNCLSVDSWAQLLRYNRPAILVLKDNKQYHRIILSSVSPATATITFNHRSHTVNNDELRQLWNGNAVIFTKPNNISSQLLKIGHRSPQVILLRQQLNSVMDVANLPRLASESSPLFDDDISTKLSALQFKYGLINDGKVGTETYLLINELLQATNIPILRAR